VRWRVVIAFVLTLLVLAWVSQGQQVIGPWVGLRIPIYDATKLGQANPYLYLKLNPNQFQIDPDPAKTSDGIWSIKGSVPVGNYVGGPTGAIIVNYAVTPPEIDIDTSMVPRKAQSETITGHWTFLQP
jgi:hypothetical protein